MVEYLIVGAGPAGLQLAYLLQRAGRDHLVLEAGPRAGTFFRTFPRHRRLISINKLHTGTDDPELNLRMDWNSLLSDDPALRFPNYTGRYLPAADDLTAYLEDFAVASGARIRYDTRVVEIAKDGAADGGGFLVTDQHGHVERADRVIVATGVGTPYIPDVPGIETAENYTTVSVEPEDFVDQRVLIIGKGNSGFETAANLIEHAAVIHVAGPSSIRMAWRSHFVGHLRAVNNDFLDTYQLKSQNALLDGHVIRIVRDGSGYLVTFSFSRANEVTKDIPYDRVIVCTGFRFDAGVFADGCRPDLVINNRFPALTSAWESTNVPDLYFAGTLMQARDYKVSTGGFIHGFRYGVRSLYRMLDQRYHGAAWPARTLPVRPGALMEAVIARVNRTSALWQQFGVLCDVIVVDGDGHGEGGGAGGGVARYLEEVPVDYVHDTDLSGGRLLFLITLEYGEGHDAVDPFDVDIARISQSEVANSHQGRYLHPVVRAFVVGEQVGEHHVTENLENEWDGPTHRGPLEAFFDQQLRAIGASVGAPA
jgi:thioredoxin reductase